jgi:hypothetical protein
MELTRFKRELRQVGYPSHLEALDLLDAIDEVLEDADLFEESLRQGGQTTEEGTARFVEENSAALIQALIEIQSVGVSGILAVILEQQGYENLCAWLAEVHQKQSQETTELSDLDDHPF